MSIDLQVKIYSILGFVARAIGVISIAMVVLTVVSVLMSVKRERPLTVKKLLLSVLFSAASLAVFLYFSKIKIELEQWLIFGGIGLALGYLWARTIKVYRKDDGVYNKNTLLYIVVWGVTFGLSQLFASLRAEYVNAALLSSILSAGIVVGMNGMLLKQFMGLSKQKPEP